MKQIFFLLFFAMTAALFASAKPAAGAAKPAETAKPATAAKPVETAKPAAAEQTAVSVLNSIYAENRAPSDFADREKAEALLKQRAELVRKIQDERKRILKEDPKAKELNEDIMRQLRQLASLLETKKSMIELNFQLDELDDAISRLKPAPPPETETEDAKKEDSGKADKTDNADKADKTKKE